MKLKDHRTAMVFDFTRRSGVVAAAIIAPVDAGQFVRDRAELWNAAEQAEKRKDSRTAREWILALPCELDTEQRANLARAFAGELVNRYGVAADVAIHSPSRSGDDRNHHAHILTTTRVVSGESLGEKSELELSDTKRKTLGLVPAADEITKLRERWAELANAALEKAGTEARIDHRSLAVQQADAFERGDLAEALALDREPQQHAGVHATQMDRRAGQVVSLRGLARERAITAAHRAAFSAGRRAPVLIDIERGEAAAMVCAEIGPVWAESGPEAANDIPERAEFGTPTATPPLLCAESGTPPTNNTHDCAESGPAHPERAESGTSKEAPMIQWPTRPRPSADVENEITRRQRDVEARLDEAIPDRRHAREAVAVAKWRVGQIRSTQELIAADEAEVRLWDRKHRWRALLDRAGIQQSPERRTLLATLAERREALEEAQAQATDAKSKASHLMAAVQRHERAERAAIEAAAAVDAAELPRLREELEKAKAFEAAHTARAKLFRPQATQAEAALPVPIPSFDPLRVVAFESGRVDRMGPGHSFQAAFNTARRAGLVVWDNVAIRGAAAALAAGNTVGDVRAALGGCWPGDPARIEDLVQEGRAQLVVDQVREAIEAGAEPATRAGVELVAMVREYGQDDAQARLAVSAALDASLEALARDSALRGDQESDRPAPRLG